MQQALVVCKVRRATSKKQVGRQKHRRYSKLSWIQERCVQNTVRR